MTPAGCVASVIFAFVGAAPLVSGHDAMTLDQTRAPHGGQVRMAGPYHIELVLGKDAAQARQPIRVYLQNHFFENVPVKGLTGKVELKDGDDIKTITLTAAGANAFRAFARYPNRTTLEANVTITEATGQQWSATFNPFAALDAPISDIPNQLR